MDVEKLITELKKINSGDFFSGVPDSLLSHFCNYIMDTKGVCKNHIVAANEGNAVALAAGYHLATGKIPVVYLQNSGIGNAINPITSLLNEKVYGIPCIFIVGWRGEPGVKDEPQHVHQGKITCELLEDVGIKTFIISKDTTDAEIAAFIYNNKCLLDEGRSIAFVIRKGAINPRIKPQYKNSYSLIREEVIREIVKATTDDIIISTTGKASRELFEIREDERQSHKYDFLTVGSMGHSSSIALGIALHKPTTKIWCIDGDGAALMHMGAMAVIGAHAPDNFVHVIINNSAHESVGGIPTVAKKVDFLRIAEGCGYKCCFMADNYDNLRDILALIKETKELCFLEVKTAIGARDNLGRPTTTPRENKKLFMDYLKEKA